MTFDAVSVTLIALIAACLLLLLWIGLRPGEGSRIEQSLRNDVNESARGTRQELAQSLALFQQGLLTQQGDAVRTQNEQIDSFRTQLAAMQQMVGQSLQRFSDSQADQLRALSQASQQAIDQMRATVEQRLQSIQADNEKKLEQMRATVDEKLQATLEQRLGESFKQVADRLDQVHRGLGEMQLLAKDVGSLNRVLTNVKTRGGFGEVQLAALLEQVLTPEQYAAQQETVPGSNARVDFAIRLPGRREDGAPLWLPIDAKFPRDDYERLVEAQERADPEAVATHARDLERALRVQARSIREKYVRAPHTTDFAILFVPTEGLYAEALRRPGLVQALQNEHRVTLAGPTTLMATLNSLQMGFRTLALERRSAEVWEVLGAVKGEFAKFGEVLAKTKKKLEEASNTIDAAAVRTRAMARQLRDVEMLPDASAQALLPGVEDDDAEGPAGA